MKLLFILLLALQASDCATAGSIQDSSVTKAKRETDAEDSAKRKPAPTPQPPQKMPQRPSGVTK